MSGQVNIGDAGPPHEGAILEVSAETKAGGILFPHVGLKDVKEFQLPGDSTIAVGMVVYNTDKPTANTTTVDGEGPGLYIWDWVPAVPPATNPTLRWIPYGRGGGNNLPAVTITPEPYCGGVKFIITRPNPTGTWADSGWTQAEWALLSPANVYATINGVPVGGIWATETSTSYSYTIVNTSNTSKTVTITVGGTITVGSVTKIVEPSTRSETVLAATGNDVFRISGVDCFDINSTNDPIRTTADFSKDYDYLLNRDSSSGGTVAVTWNITENPGGATSIVSQDNNKATVRFSKDSLDNMNITATGIYVVITATVKVTGSAVTSSCPNGEIYVVSFSINIRDSDCCGSVVDHEGNMYTAKRFGDQCWMTQNLRSVLGRTGQKISNPPPEINNPDYHTYWVTMNPGKSAHGAGDNTAVRVWWNGSSLEWSNTNEFKYRENGIEKTYYGAADYSLFADKFGFLYPENVIVDKYKYPTDPPSKWIPNDDICPAIGWRLPRIEDVQYLSTFLGPNSGKKIRANNFLYQPYRFKPTEYVYGTGNLLSPQSPEYTHYYQWEGYAPDDSRNSGFNLLPAGSTRVNVISGIPTIYGDNFGLRGSFWTATKYSAATNAPTVIVETSLETYATFSHFDLLPGGIGFTVAGSGLLSVRCVRDMQP
jgi:hypothetical protein